MRHFPFKTLILCVLLPPFVYVFSIQLLENIIQARYDKELTGAYIGDTRHLFEGSIRIKDAIQKNVNAFLDSRKLTNWGVRVDVTVKTKDGIYLYPDTFDEQDSDFAVHNGIAVARENFRLLNDGLIKVLNVKVEQNSPVSNSILLSCVMVPLIVLFFIYRRGMKRTNEEELAKQGIIDDLSTERHKNLSQLEKLESERLILSGEIDLMKAELASERQKASATEDEMMDELVVLEEKISRNMAQRDRQYNEINELREKIKQFEKAHEAKSRQLLKGTEAVRKRFNVLYKNITCHDRAIDGFVDLTEEMKIKAEEVIHQLNDDPNAVQIKRKVFGKKNRETVFEVIFAYKGRLYFHKISGNQVEILVVGTKLTQNKDLAFLDKL